MKSNLSYIFNKYAYSSENVCTKIFLKFLPDNNALKSPNLLYTSELHIITMEMESHVILLLIKLIYKQTIIIACLDVFITMY